VVSGTPESLVAALGGDVVRIEVERGGGVRERLEGAEGVTGVALEGGDGAGSAFRVTVADGPRRLAELVDRARSAGVVSVTLRRPGLEHVFLHHTGHRFEEREA
jgi:ABC-2 type transport system ATP-binding protein